MKYQQWEVPLEALSPQQYQAFEYWQSLAAPGGVPLFSDFELLACPTGALPLIHIVDVLDGGEEFKYRYWGSGFRNHLGYDGTGRVIGDLRPVEIVEPVRDANRRVMRERRAMAMMSEFERGVRASSMGFQRFLRLPLATPDGDIGQIVSVVEFLQNYHESQKIISKYDGELF